MPRSPTPHIVAYAVLLGGLAAWLGWAFTHYTLGDPYQWWITDMMDSVFVKAYRAEMRPVPEGAVSRNRHVPNHQRMSAQGQALRNPYPVDDDLLATGKWAFGVYCSPCHNSDAMGGGPVTDNTNGKKRFMMPAPALAGAAGVARLRSDGYIYLTIRNGGAIMPPQHDSMEDREMWAVVAWLRTLPGAAWQPPAAQ